MKKLQGPKKKITYKYIDIFKYWQKDGHTGNFGQELWYVANLTTWKIIVCSSEVACKKIIEVALAELNEVPHTVNRVSLELKAELLIKD